MTKHLPIANHIVYPKLFLCISRSSAWSVGVLICAFWNRHHISSLVDRTASLSWHWSRWTSLVRSSAFLLRSTFAWTVPSLFNFSLSWLRSTVCQILNTKLVLVISIETRIGLSQACRCVLSCVWNISNCFYFSCRNGLLACTPLLLFIWLEVVSPAAMQWNAVRSVHVRNVVPRKSAGTSDVFLLLWALLSWFSQYLFFKNKLFIRGSLAERDFSWRGSLLVAGSRHTILWHVVIWWYAHSIFVWGVKSVLCKLNLSLLFLRDLIQPVNFTSNLLL